MKRYYSLHHMASVAALLGLGAGPRLSQGSSLTIHYMTTPNAPIYAGTFNNVSGKQNPCQSNVTIRNSSGNCYITPQLHNRRLL